MVAQIKHYTRAERALSTLRSRHGEPTMMKTLKNVPIYRVGCVGVGGKKFLKNFFSLPL